MNSDTRSINLLQKVEPVDSFWNWNHDKKKNNNNFFKKWRVDEKKRFSPTEIFSTHRGKETFLLGPGAGVGVGCGAGVGFGLVGGVGYSGWPWNHLRLVFGFGMGCGLGAGFGYGQGLGYGSSWKSIKDDLFGRKKDPHNRVILHI